MKHKSQSLYKTIIGWALLYDRERAREKKTQKKERTKRFSFPSVKRIDFEMSSNGVRRTFDTLVSL